MPCFGNYNKDGQDFLVIYTITRGFWTNSGNFKRFMPSSGDVPETKTKVFTAKDYIDAKNIAFKELSKVKSVNEYLKICKAVPIAKKKDVV